MSNRREFLTSAGAAAAGILFTGCGFAAPQGAARRREVSIAGRRIKTVDIHAHCTVPDVWELVKDYDWAGSPQLDIPKGLSLTNLQERLRAMDQWGVDIQAISINPFWYPADRDLADQIIKIQNEKLAGLCAAHPDRFVGLASVALQYPYLAAEQLENGVKKLGMRGCLIGGSVNGADLSAAKFNPFWAKAEQLGVVVFIHPQPSGAAADLPGRLQGNGGLSNVIGNPLETTIALSHLIFEGTLDRYPGLKICAAHAGGYLPSYIGRSDACSVWNASLCKSVKKRPSEYLKQLYFDSMVFTTEGLRHLVAEAGASQIVMGTDFPYGWTTEAVDHIIRTPTLTDAERAAILGETAQKLLGISA